MTPVIRTDEQVMDELNKRAIRLGTAFVTPNDILRIVLGLDASARVRTSSGRGGGKRFPVKTEELISSKYAALPYNDSGMTFKQAWESNSDKNWRYAIRKAILKAERDDIQRKIRELEKEQAEVDLQDKTLTGWNTERENEIQKNIDSLRLELDKISR